MNRDSLDAVYRQYARDVFLYAYSLLDNVHDAEEVTSETFYRALLTAGKQNAPVKYWLLKVCRNLCMDQFRRTKRLTGGPPDETKPDKDADVLARIVKDEETRRLYALMMRLSKVQRELLYMFYFARYSVAEIAAMLDRTPGSVKTALSRARVRLRKMMKEA